ncbi:MAG TPA: DUF445 family protein [Firmicutes bacterium]|nr:DUF445 family protein [Bacillota bacterium]
MDWQLILLPLIAAAIGWVTNVIAIKMLFWPRTPWNIFGWKFWGVLPKRKGEIAASIGQVLNDDLLPTEDLLAAVNTPEIRDSIASYIAGNVEERLEPYLPFFIPENAKKKIKQHLERLFRAEAEKQLGGLGTSFSRELQEKKILGNLVEEKINSFDIFQLEDLIHKVAKKELRHIEFFGAVLGFLIGVIQVVILLLF